MHVHLVKQEEGNYSDRISQSKKERIPPSAPSTFTNPRTIADIYHAQNEKSSY